MTEFSSNSDTVESSIEVLPDKFLSGLLGDALKEDDPRMRDFGERYEFRDILGKGGQGVVLAVKDNTLERVVALKTLKGHSNKIKEEFLEKEAKISGHLEHPNIPPTYDLGFDETGCPFFVMRKLSGVSLDEILLHKKNEMENKNSETKSPNTNSELDYSRIRLLSIFIQVCNAIEYAHARNILHLDIKPQNVKLGQFGEVFVIDWGFATKKDEEQKVLGGTPIYIAPERFKRKKPDERSDIYSLGVLLYRILTLKRPFDVSSLSFKDFCKDFDKLELIKPRARDSSIPPELEAITLKAMAKDREERYASAKDLSADLQRFLDGLPVTAFEAGRINRLWKTIKRHRTISVLIVALFVAVISIAAIAKHSHDINKKRKIAEKQRAKILKQERKATAIRNKAIIPYQKGRDFLDRTPPQLNGAKRFFSKAISIDPSFADAYFERAKVHARLGNSLEALADYRQTLIVKPSFVMAHYYAGIILMDVAELRDINAAKKEFVEMQKVDPNSEYSNLGLARLHILNNEMQKALELCSKIEARSPDFKEIYYLKGFIFGKRNTSFYNPQKALKQYDLYLDTVKDNIVAYLNRGDIRRREGDIDGAIKDYNSALNLNPDYVWALNNRGWIYYSVPNKRDINKALSDFNRAAIARPEYYWTYMNRAAVYEFLKKWQRAEEDYHWASDLRPKSNKVFERMGLCYFRQFRFKLSAENFQKAREMANKKTSYSLFLNMGMNYISSNNPQKALTCFEQALNKDTKDKFYAAMFRHIALIELGKIPDPNDLLSYIPDDKDNPKQSIYTNIVKCWQGITTPNIILKNIKDPVMKSKAFYFLAMYLKLMTEDKTGATKLFKECIKTGIHLYPEYILASIEVKGKIVNDVGIN